MSSIPDPIVRFLQDPGSHNPRPEQVDTIQTHSAMVFLAGPLVYKVKKPVQLGFLDFSTLEARRIDAEREVRLNRRLAPDLYLGVVAIHEGNGSPTFQPIGPVIEYSVCMHRLDDAGFALNRLAMGTFREAEIDRVADHLAAFYASPASRTGHPELGRAGEIRVSTDENLRQIREWSGDTLPEAGIRMLEFHAELFYTRRSALFESRVREERIRDCHGDLHLEHIHLTPDALTIYDCIAFNERFRTIDIASDVAFLAMDLERRGHWDLAARLARRIAAAVPDPRIPELLDFYKIYRACVRTKVGLIEASEAEIPGTRRAEARREAAEALSLAMRYAVVGTPPAALVLMGPVATGKSTLAHRLAKLLGWPRVSSDEERKRLAGLPVSERPPADIRRDLYAPAMTDRTYESLLTTASAALATHQPVLVDATFSEPERRAAFLNGLQHMPGRVIWVEVHAPHDLRQRHLAERADIPGTSDARLDDLPALDARYTPPREIANADRFRLQADRDVDETTNTLLHRLVERQVG